MKLTESQIRRYSRQILLPNVGGRGQKALLAGELCLYGLGPVGAYCALYLAAAGVGRLYLHDTTLVSKEDVGVAGLYQVEDIGATRQQALHKRLSTVNPDAAIVAAPSVTPSSPSVIPAKAGIQNAKSIVCGAFNGELPHQVGVRAGVSSYRAVLQVGCLACSPQLSDGEGVLDAALALSVGALAAYEALRLVLGDEATHNTSLSFGSLQIEPRRESLSCEHP